MAETIVTCECRAVYGRTTTKLTVRDKDSFECKCGHTIESLERFRAAHLSEDFGRPGSVHQTLKMSPAMAAGVTSRLWDMTDLVEMIEALEFAATDYDLRCFRGCF